MRMPEGGLQETKLKARIKIPLRMSRLAKTVDCFFCLNEMAFKPLTVSRCPDFPRKQRTSGYPKS